MSRSRPLDNLYTLASVIYNSGAGMPYARQFVKVNIEGAFGTSVAAKVEDWRTGFHISTLGGGSFDPATLLTFCTAIVPAVTAYHTSANVKAGSNTWLSAISAALIGTDGLYVLGGLQPTTRYTLPTAAAGNGGAVAPNTQSLCITLRSLVLRGPASHGRMYWPAVSFSPQTQLGGIVTASADATASLAKTMLDTINTAAGATFGSNSKISLVSKVGAGKEAVVTSCGIGLKFDHMESRERNAPEAHVMKNLVVSTALTQARDQQLRDEFDRLLDDAPQ